MTDAGTDTAMDDSKLGSRSDDDNARDDRQHLDPTPQQDRVGIGRVVEMGERIGAKLEPDLRALRGGDDRRALGVGDRIEHLDERGHLGRETDRIKPDAIVLRVLPRRAAARLPPRSGKRMSQSFNQVGEQVVGRSLSIQPTLVAPMLLLQLNADRTNARG